MLPDRSLVLYKNRPAIVEGTTDRVEIILEDGSEVRVRPKDVVLLHPGPVRGFSDLASAQGEVAEAWDVVRGQGDEAGAPTTLRDLAELCHGSFTPASAWATWLAVADGLYFEGVPDGIVALARTEVERRAATRRAEAEEKAARVRFLDHARSGRVGPEDTRYVREIEDVATGKNQRSRLLKDLEHPDSPEGAHTLLLDLGVWTPAVNPHPARVKADTSISTLPYSPVPSDAPRLDLTALEAYAIDDEGTTTPDDAVSFDGERVWVHIADPAGFLPLGNPLDEDACRRGETLHLPEKVIHMLPSEAITALGLGIQETSPALSICLEIEADGNARARQVAPSLVRVRRLTYDEAEARITEAPFGAIMGVVDAYRRAREARGAFTLDLPEAHFSVDAGGRVHLDPLGRPTSRLMVQEAMVMTGQALARWAAERGLPVPFSSQEGSSAVAEIAAARQTGSSRPAPLSQLWAARRTLRRSTRTLAPGRHAGLAVEPYCQTTSPLRRYLDFLTHHQIRAALEGRPPLAPEDVTRRIGEVEAVIPRLRQAEILSERHWTLVYLLQNPGWSGDGVVVDQRERNLTVVVPSLAIEAQVNTRKPVELDGILRLKVQEVRLPLLEVHFSVV